MIDGIDYSKAVNWSDVLVTGIIYHACKYISFRYVEQKTVTQVWDVVNNKNYQIVVGQVKWLGRWRQYIFLPNPDTVFSRGCLEDIMGFIDILMIQRGMFKKK